MGDSHSGARKMARKELSKMNLDQLKALRKEVDTAISEFSDRKRADALKALEAVAKEHGMSVDEIVGTTGGKKRKAKAPAKYRNPANSKDTWSGRGRQPRWFKEALENGAKPESMGV
jgi:DNA-binding protein H-NS